MEPYRAYLEARFVDDPQVRASALFGELVPLGFDRSCPTLVRELRELALRPVCDCCKAGGVKVTVGLDHEPGEELQLDWLELSETPWGEKAYVLVGALSHSGRAGRRRRRVGCVRDQPLQRPARATRRRPSPSGPGERALAEAARLRGQDPGGVVVDLDQYARIAKVAGGRS